MNKPVISQDYQSWIKDLKLKIRNVQIKVAVKINTELLYFYWELGADIVKKQAASTWGDKFLSQLSQDLLSEFPGIKGFSKRNLELIRQWFCFWSESFSITKQLVSQLPQTPKIEWIIDQITQIPWGHNIAIMSKCNNTDEALFYIQNTSMHNWSRSVLVHQIESNLFEREGKAINNFSIALPKPQSDLAKQALKDPYVFDFMTMTSNYNERDLEKGLVDHITHFLLELGAGFAYVGKQVPVQVGSKAYFIDLLFYHTTLHCYIVIELKAVEFEPEHAGKLNFYIKTVDSQLRKEGDQPTIGFLLYKSKDKLVVEY